MTEALHSSSVRSTPGSEYDVKILFVAGVLTSGGAERQLTTLLREMDHQKWRPAVAVLDLNDKSVYRDEIESLGVPLYSIPRAGGQLFRMFRFIKLCRRLKPELIHSSHYYTNIYAALGAFFSGCKAIGSIRASLKGLRKGYSAPVVALNNLFPRHLISNNQASIDDLKRHPSWNAPRKLSHIPNCVNLDDWPLHPFPARSSLRLIGVGSLVPVKNWEFMVEALYLFGKRAKFPWNCTIVGDGPLRSSLEEQIQRLELAEKIQLLGYRKDIGKLVGDSHLHLLTSTREGSPNAVLEALASGRPTLSVDVGEVPYLVSFGENGLVVPEGDMDAFVRTLLSIEGDFDRLQRMGAQARKRVEEQHSVSILIDSLEAIYKEEGIAP